MKTWLVWGSETWFWSVFGVSREGARVIMVVSECVYVYGDRENGSVISNIIRVCVCVLGGNEWGGEVVDGEGAATT